MFNGLRVKDGENNEVDFYTLLRMQSQIKQKKEKKSRVQREEWMLKPPDSFKFNQNRDEGKKRRGFSKSDPLPRYGYTELNPDINNAVKYTQGDSNLGVGDGGRHWKIQAEVRKDPSYIAPRPKFIPRKEEEINQFPSSFGVQKKKNRHKKRGRDYNNRQDSNDQAGQKRKKKKRKLGERVCDFCFKFSDFKKHLVIALGNHSWLGIPHFGQASPLHLIISPYSHRKSLCHVEESEWREIQRFKAAVASMYRELGFEAVFLETISARHLEKDMHCCVECIELPRTLFLQAPSYFKKALMDSDERWSQHKRVIETLSSGNKSIRSVIPKNFPYFHVEFGFGGKGMAHVIEGKNFAFRFGKEVILGMKKMDTLERKLAKRSTFEEEKKTVLDIVDKFKKFDFTLEYDND